MTTIRFLIYFVVLIGVTTLFLLCIMWLGLRVSERKYTQLKDEEDEDDK